MKAWLVLLVTLPLLAVGSGATASSSTPPRNGLIAVNGGGGGLYLVDPASGTAAPIAAAADASEATWSSDGTLLAFTVWSRDDDTPSVYTMKPDGSNRMLVARNASSPTWAPDGESLAVVRDSYTKLGEERFELVVVSSDGKSERVLLPKASTSAVYFSSLAWSPNGKVIAFVDATGGVHLVTPNGETAGVFDSEATGAGLSWSPDSSRLAFDSFRNSKSESRQVVVVLDVATGKEAVLKGEQQGAQAPAWSPEGDQIAFLSMAMRARSSTPSDFVEEPYETHLWSMRPDGTTAHPLAAPALFGQPSWGRATATISAPSPGVGQQKPAPMTKREPAPAPGAPIPTPGSAQIPKPATGPMPSVATPTRRAAAKPRQSSKLLDGANGLIAVRGKGSIYVIDPKIANVRAVPRTGDMWAPAWSPTMKELAVQKSEKNGSSSIYTIRPDGTHAQLVLENASAPSWSAAGDRIFAIRSDCTGPCDSDDDAANVLYSVNADGTGAERVAAGDSDAFTSRELAWPVDGSSIHFFDDESLSGPGTFDSSAATWSPDQTELAFTGALHASEDESSDNGLWIVSAEGGTPTLLLSGAIGRPSWAR